MKFKTGRKVTVLHLYFGCSIDKNKSTSKLLNCPNHVRSGRHAGNLKTRINIYYKDEYELILIKEKDNFQSKESFSIIVEK